MKDFEALKSIWMDQVEVPKVNERDILKRIRHNRNSLATKLLLELLGMSVAISVLAYVWVDSPFRMRTTHLAMLMFMFCCLYYIINLIGTYKRIRYKALIDLPGEYIDYLKKYRHDRYIFNTRKYRNYSIVLTTAFILYFIEIAFLASIWVTLIGVFITGVWIAFCYFYLMRIYIRKEEARLEEMIGNLERLQKQFEETY